MWRLESCGCSVSLQSAQCLLYLSFAVPYVYQKTDHLKVLVASWILPVLSPDHGTAVHLDEILSHLSWEYMFFQVEWSLYFHLRANEWSGPGISAGETGIWKHYCLSLSPSSSIKQEGGAYGRFCSHVLGDKRLHIPDLTRCLSVIFSVQLQRLWQTQPLALLMPVAQWQSLFLISAAKCMSLCV